jgi:hypothetical protein
VYTVVSYAVETSQVRMRVRFARLASGRKLIQAMDVLPTVTQFPVCPVKQEAIYQWEN